MPSAQVSPGRSEGAAATAYPAVVPVLTDGTVTLRAHRPDDAPAIVEQVTDPESQRWTTVPRQYAETDARAFLTRIREQWEQPTGDRLWAIEWVGDDGVARFGGTIDLRHRGAGRAEIGYGLHPAARGQGVMSSAVRLAAAYAFEAGPWGEPLTRIQWSAVVGNFGSRRVAWATGFTIEGTLSGWGPPYPDGQGGEIAYDHWVGSLDSGTDFEPQTPWLDIPVLEGEGIRLRPWRDADAAFNEDIAGPGHHMPAGATPSDLTFDHWLLVRRERSARGEGITWCIADGATDRPLGAVMVFAHGAPISEPGAELGYFLFPSARGRGVATAAGDLAIDHAFAPKKRGGLGLSRLSAITAADNVASNSVLERLGFVRFGVEHATDLLPDGTWEDAYHWELLRSER